jgi:hypothetical protein
MSSEKNQYLSLKARDIPSREVTPQSEAYYNNGELGVYGDVEGEIGGD